ncbi:MAG: lysophospholipid acyltransferase family protein, partial [Pseudomonadota bacterium]
AVEKLHSGENLLIFPEGTRTDDEEHLRFKRGASNVAVAAQCPIMPVLIKCHPSALKKSDKWYNIPDGGPNFSLISGDMLFLSDCIDISKAKTLQYRELTRYLEQHYQRWMAIDSPKTINNTKDTC